MSRKLSAWLPGPFWPGIVCAVAATVGIARMRLLDDAAGRMFAAAIAMLFYIVFCFVIFLGHRRKRQAQLRWQVGTGSAADSVLVAYASQTGFAVQLALRTAQSLETAGLAVNLRELAQLDPATLPEARRVLFVVSTTGEGDAPDSAGRFARKLTDTPARLDGMQYGVLALGDRSYAQYCAFGRQLDGWLRHQGAQALFDMIEVDNGDEGALRHWQHHLGVMSGHTEMADWNPPRYARWRLTQRLLLNPGSQGAGAYHLALTPPSGVLPHWQAGDIAEIGPRNAPVDVTSLLEALEFDAGQLVQEEGQSLTLRELLSRKLLPADTGQPAGLDMLRNLSAQALADHLPPLPHREYSIASLPADGRLELLVRQTVLPDGRLGLGSGWLTQHLAQGGEVDVRIRENRGFHPPVTDVPMMLIGNGTGMAGLRAQLKARIAAGRRRNWLLFGERSAQHDFFFREEIENWQANGMLQRTDLAFSRDRSEQNHGTTRLYVQDKLRQSEDELRRWIAEGAAIYVCGSLEGMAAGVARVLRDLLGEDALESMAAQGRYRRDVY